MPTLIGVELRVGYEDGLAMQEVRLFPCELNVPHGWGYNTYPVAEVTFHTSAGDVTTTRVRLPVNNHHPEGVINDAMQGRKIIEKLLAAGL